MRKPPAIVQTTMKNVFIFVLTLADCLCHGSFAYYLIFCALLRRYGLAPSIMPNWVGFHLRTEVESSLRKVVLNTIQKMDNVQKHINCSNIPSSRALKSYYVHTGLALFIPSILSFLFSSSPSLRFRTRSCPYSDSWRSSIASQTSTFLIHLCQSPWFRLLFWHSDYESRFMSIQSPSRSISLPPTPLYSYHHFVLKIFCLP
jgi:hypothetical protein